MVNRVLYVCLIISLTVFVYFLIKTLISLKRRNFVGALYESFNKKYEYRKIMKKAQELYEGSIEEEKIIDILDNFVEKSGIKKIFPFVTSEILAAATLIIALIASIIVNLKFKFWLYTIAAFIITIFTCYFLLKIMSKITCDRIDNQIMPYLGTLKNLSKSNADIVTIFEKSIPYARSPIKDYVQQFVFECKRGIPLEKAFKNLMDKVENKRFKELITNIMICSKHNADYRKLLNESKIIFKNYLSERKRRKSVAKSGRINILSVTGIGAFVFWILQSFTGSTLEKLKSSFIGNILLGYVLIVFIFALYKFLTLDKID